MKEAAATRKRPPEAGSLGTLHSPELWGQEHSHPFSRQSVQDDGVDRSDVVLGRQGAGRRDRRSRQKHLREHRDVLRLAEVEHGLHDRFLLGFQEPSSVSADAPWKRLGEAWNLSTCAYPDTTIQQYVSQTLRVNQISGVPREMDEIHISHGVYY